jgi:chromosome segregation ATPase
MLLNNVLRFVGAKNFLPLLGAMVLAACAWAYVQGLRLDAARADAAREIQACQVAHNATRAELAGARSDIVRLEVTLALARNATGFVQDSLRQAQAREAEAAGAAVARKRILDAMRTEVRAKDFSPLREVIDDATRTAVADRLNRPL